MKTLPSRRSVARMLTALAVGLLAATPALPARAAAPRVGQPFPKLETFALEGKLPETAGKVVLLDFWASWCGPCQKAFPTLKELHDTYAARGFLVLGISVDEKKSAMEGFLKKARPSFPIVRDAKGRLAESIALDTVPTSILLGKDGKVLAVHQGFDETSRKTLEKEIHAALASKAP